MSQPVQYSSAPAQAQRTDVMAILGLVFAFVFWPLGIVFSALGLRNVKRDGTGGRGLAKAGLVLSIVFGVVAVVYVVVVVAVLANGSTAP